MQGGWFARVVIGDSDMIDTVFAHEPLIRGGVFALPALAVLIIEVLLNATSMFNHGNVDLSSESTAGCAVL